MRRALLGASLCIGTLVLAQDPPDAAELARIEAAIASVQAELARTDTERSAVRAQVQASEQAIVEIRRQVRTVTEAIQTETASQAELQTRQRRLEQSRVEQQALISSYMKSAWMAGNEEYLKLLLNQQDPQQTARMLQYYRYFNAARAARIAGYNRTLTDLAAVAAELTASAARLQVRQQELTVQQQTLADSQAQRLQTLASLDSLAASRGAELQALEDRKLELERLLEELRLSIASIAVGDDQEPIGARKGKLAWPLEGRLVNSFGARQNLGDLTWEGITIAGTEGADIRAIHHGRVVFADWFSSSGLLLIIDHGDGYMSLYAHNQELYKAVGDWVAGGATIAAVGNTGGQRDYGLYFEMRRNGKAENPVNWLVTRQ
jgi:septal ring factor EnvC (AmiA/AmiB activator)